MDLIQDTGTRRLTAAVPSEKYPVIRSARSSFDVLLASLPDLVGLASDVADRAARMLSDENIASVSNALTNIDKASATLPQTLKEVQSLVVELRDAAGDVRSVAQEGHHVRRSTHPMRDDR